MTTQKPPIRFGADGLIPAVIQEASTGAVLMVGFMNEAALHATRSTGRVHFWSRSRGKLWRKGETSGHEQMVEAIAVNCEQNSLLVSVRQIGAVCHDGYDTCFYRRLELDDSLTVIRERVFDPETVYGDASVPPELTRVTQQLYGAYEYLAQHDLTAVSATSRRLRAAEDTVTNRVGDELRELAGVLEGTHRHDSFAADVHLEATQVIYWLILAAVRAGQSWEELRPDRALTAPVASVAPADIANGLRAEADQWATESSGFSPARFRTALRLIGTVCGVAGVLPIALTEADLTELQGKPYLAPYFVPPMRPSPGQETGVG